MDHSQDQSGAVAAAMAAYGLFIGLIFLVAIVLSLVVNWRIASKAGHSGVLSLLMLIPLVNFLVILVFAFTEWPVERELKIARSGGYGGYGGGGGGWQPQAPQPVPPQTPQLGTWGPPTTSG